MSLIACECLVRFADGSEVSERSNSGPDLLDTRGSVLDIDDRSVTVQELVMTVWRKWRKL